MKIFTFLFLLFPFASLGQQAEVKQLKFILHDLLSNFKENIDTLKAIEWGDSSYSSKLTLIGSLDNKISISRTWASYTAFISDSCSLKEAKRLVGHWRDIIQAAAPHYLETKEDGKHKTVSGYPFWGYKFNLMDQLYKYWISLIYARRPAGKGYSVILIIGKEMQ